jgi:MFS family permease
MAGVGSPLATDFFLKIGATEFHFGMLSGLPMIAVFLQFAGAVAANTIRRRKPSFMVMVILCRLLYLPIAFLPILFPSIGSNRMMSILICLVAISSALGNITGPMWLSWMADIVPYRVLNTYWGTRQRYLNLVSTAASVVIAGIAWVAASTPIIMLFPIIVSVAVVAGVADILLFIWVDEPPNTIVTGMPVTQVLLAPFKHPEYRTFLAYCCAWSASTMFAAAFMLPYTLKVLKIPKDLATLIWCTAGIGVALSSRKWGQIADRHGQKPVLAFCTYFKSLIALVFLLVTPTTAVWVLPIAFIFDGAWNSGNMVATNGYMMKVAPRENRSMFIAALTGFSGICGGLAAIASGWLLESLSWFKFEAFGRTWINYHVVFLLSVFMRLACAASLPLVREPNSATTGHILDELLDVWPMNLIRFPIDLYRKHIVGK